MRREHGDAGARLLEEFARGSFQRILVIIDFPLEGGPLVRALPPAWREFFASQQNQNVPLVYCVR